MFFIPPSRSCIPQCDFDSGGRGEQKNPFGITGAPEAQPYPTRSYSLMFNSSQWGEFKCNLLFLLMGVGVVKINMETPWGVGPVRRVDGELTSLQHADTGAVH